MEATKQPEQEPGKGEAIVIVERVTTGEELHREVVASDEVGELIARLVRERGDAQDA